MRNLVKTIGLLAIACTFLFASCQKMYVIKVESNNPEWGTVSGGGLYSDGEQIVIAAVPANGYYFNYWNDGNTDNPRTVIVSGSTTYTATFSDQPGTGGGGINGSINLDGTMSENRTLADLGLDIDYIIDGTLYIQGNACLTIEPGVTIAFTGVDGCIHVGENAGLKMVGTEAKPIILRGPINNNNIGSWSCVEYNSRRADNQLEYVQFLNGGSENCVLYLVGDSKVSMKHCTINGSTAKGIAMWYGSEEKFYAFENNTIRNCSTYPLVLDDCKSILQLGSGNVYENNHDNYILVCDSWIDDGSTITFNNQGIPYCFSDDFFATHASKMIVDPGVTLCFKNNCLLDIADDCYLQVNGTAAEPVVIRSLSNESGYWQGINIHCDRTTQGGSFLHYCTISGCGSDENFACLRIDEHTQLALDHVTLANCDTYGISLYLPSELNFETDDYDYFWDRLGLTANELSYTNCHLGHVYDRNSEQVYDGSLIPGASKHRR